MTAQAIVLSKHEAAYKAHVVVCKDCQDNPDEICKESDLLAGAVIDWLHYIAMEEMRE
jgi:predicted metal-binding protein